MKKQGHYCKVCGVYKANEAFSGKGHAAHICKKCASLPLEDRNREILLTRIDNLPWRLSKEQTAWLKGLTKDRRSEVSAAAKEHFQRRFPYAARNERKRQLHIASMHMSVCDVLYDEYGDEFLVDAAFTLDRKSHTVVMRTAEGESSALLEPKAMVKLLKHIVNEYEVFCIDEDYALNPEQYSIDLSNSEDDEWMSSCDVEQADFAEDEKQTWALHLEYTNGETQDFVSCLPVPDRLSELVMELLDYFFEEDDFEEYDE